MAPRNFSLAAALWDFPQADDCAAPTQHAPDTWPVLFEEKHTDSQVLHGMFTSCPKGKQWALQRAKTATLKLDTTDGTDHATWQRRAAAAQQALGIRGSLPTRLQITTNNSAESRAACEVLARLPFADFKGITHFAIKDTSRMDWRSETCARLLSAAVQAPNLTSLDLDCLPSTFPTPSQVPKVTHLTLRVREADYLDSWLIFADALLDQLTYLNISQENNNNVVGPLLFDLPENKVCPLLADLTLPDDLDGRLIDYLTTHTPFLQRLTVNRLWPRLQMDEEIEWAVRELEITTCEHETGLYLLTRLPRGPLRIKVNKMSCVAASAQGLHVEESQRMEEWQISAQTVRVEVLKDVPHADDPAALTSTLQQLNPLQNHARLTASHIILTDEFLWTPRELEALAAALPTLPDRLVSVEIDVLTDELLSLLLDMRTQLRGVSANSVMLDWDHRALETWPWPELCVKELSVSELAKLPRVSKVSCETLYMDNAAMDVKMDYQRLQRRLPHIKWTHPSPVISLSTQHEANTLDTLQHKLTLLRAIRLGEAHTVPTTLRVGGWKMTTEVIQALQQLPAWPCVLDFTQPSPTKWPLFEPQYALLAQCVPKSYTEWRLGAVSQGVFLCICAGLKVWREGFRGPPLRVRVKTAGWSNVRPEGRHVEVISEDAKGGNSVPSCFLYWAIPFFRT